MTDADTVEAVARRIHAAWERQPRRETVLPAMLAVARTAAGLKDQPVQVGGLTPGQLHTLRLAATGMSNAEIAAQRGISVVAAKSSLSSTLKVLGAKNRVHAVVLAYRAGLVVLDGVG